MDGRYVYSSNRPNEKETKKGPKYKLSRVIFDPTRTDLFFWRRNSRLVSFSCGFIHTWSLLRTCFYYEMRCSTFGKERSPATTGIFLRVFFVDAFVIKCSYDCEMRSAQSSNTCCMIRGHEKEEEAEWVSPANPTDTFTILEPQSPSIDKFYGARKCQSPELEALKLWMYRSGKNLGGSVR